MVDINLTISIITSYINILNVPDPAICCLQEICFKYKYTDRLKIKRWRTIYHSNNNQKKADV